MLGKAILGCTLVSFALGCSGSVGSADPDAGGPVDVGIVRDAGFADARADAGPVDARPSDASASDASPTDDAEVDAGTPPDAGPPTHGCAGTTYKLCEDFEGAPSQGVPADWRRVMPYSPDPGSANAAEVMVATDQPHWGTQSLKSTSNDCAQTRMEHDISALGATAGLHWGRVFFYVDTPAPQSNMNGGWYHTTMVGLRGDNSGGGDARECRVVDMVENAFDQSVAFLYNVPDDSCCSATEVNPYSFQYEEVWHCAEWFVDASTDSYRFFLDGTELLSFTNDAGSRLSQCDVSVAVGALCYAPPLNAPQNFTAWLDDFAIDDNRIGCQ